MHPLTSFSITVIAGLSWRGHHRDIRDIWPLCHPWGCDTHRAHISKHHKIERESIVFRLSLPLSNSIGEQTQTGRLMGPWFNLVIELNWLNETKQLELLSNLEFTHTHQWRVFMDSLMTRMTFRCQMSDIWADVGDMSPVGGSGAMFYCGPHIVFVLNIKS